MKCILICNNLKEGITFSKLRILNVFFNAYLNSVPTDQYEIHTNFTVLFNALLNISKEKESFSIKESLVLDVDYATNNYYEALILSSIGMPSLSLDYEVTGLFPFLASEDPFTINIEKIEVAMKHNIAGVREIIMALSSNFFYLSRILGHNYLQAHALYLQTKQLLLVGIDANEEDIDYLCYYGSLLGASYLPDIANEVLSALKEQYSIEYSRNPNQATKIAEVLTSEFAVLSGESIVEWAKKALSVPKAEIKLQSLVDLKLTVLLKEEILNKKAIWRTLVTMLDYINGNTSDEIGNDLQRQRLSNYPIRVIVRAIELKDYFFAIRCAYLWMTYQKGHGPGLARLSEQTILLALPLFNLQKSVFIFHHNSNSHFFEVDNRLESETFISIKNKFEGNWTVLLGQVTPSQPPSSHGKGPIITESDRYEEALRQMLSFESLTNILKQVPKSEVIRVLEVPGLNLPLSSLFGILCERSMSTLVSDEPQSRTEINKVLIWCDPEGNLFDAYREKEALETLLNKNGIYFESYSFTQCSFELFLSKYVDMKFDLVWIMCHANFDNNDPPSSKLNVSKDQYITLRSLSLLRVKERINRRLLVLNACESGCSPIRYTAMGHVGLSQSLANNFQSVVGHLWPVSSFVATIFGTLLMSKLIEGASWAEAVNNVRIDISKGNKHIEVILTSILGAESQLVESLLNRQEELNKLVYWASPNLYE